MTPFCRHRIALGGVATKPWRARAAEGVLNGQKPSADVFARAADAELAAAVGREHNTFKIALCRQTIVRALQNAAAVT